MSRTAGEAIAGALRALGVERVFGHPLGDLPVAEVSHADVALLLADAAGRIGDGWGAALVDGQVLHVSSRPGGTAHPTTVRDATELAGALAPLRHESTPATVAFHLDLDLDAPAPEVAMVVPERRPVVTLSPSLADLAILVVVGPGVARGHAAALEQLALAGGFGVFNTWGAKGVLRWDSPHHFGTVGLQEGDVELMGLDRVDLIVTSGIDPAELPPSTLSGKLVQDVPPWQLEALLVDWPTARRRVGERPPLYDTIASVVTPLYERASSPITPPRAALHLAGAAPADGVVVADAGVAGFWIARTFPTGIPGSVVVPSLDQPGFAAAAALAAGLGGRPCVAVVDGPPDESTMLVLEEAALLGVPVSVQSWVDGADAPTAPDEHVEICRRGFAGDGPNLDVVGVEAGLLSSLVEVAGPPMAWG